jgi:putative ABC transport system permease protein
MRDAARRLMRSPSFPLSAIATLALGIAAATALFSVVTAVLLTALPFSAALLASSLPVGRLARASR